MSSREAGAGKNVGTLPKNQEEDTDEPGLASGAPSSHRRTGGGIAPSRSAKKNGPCRFFFEDEVFRIDSRGRVHFGVITETAESHSSEDEDDNEPLFTGEVRVAFYPDGKEQIRMESAIGLADRTLMPGDVVRRRLPGQRDLTGPSGYVRNVSVTADVKVLGSKFVIKNVPAERLRPISQWARDIPVCFDTWVGTTIHVDEVAVLRTGSGGRLEIGSAYFHKFRDANSKSLPEVFTPHVLFPGNVVLGRLPPFDRFLNLTPDIPLPANRKRALYTVESIETLGVNVAWTCRATTNDCTCDPLKQPKTEVVGEELMQMKRLNIYESYMLQIHDRFFLKYSKHDTLLNHQDWEEELTAKYKSIYENQGIVETKRNKPKSSSSASGRNAPKFRRILNKSGHSRSRSNGDIEANVSLRGREAGSESSTKLSSSNHDETSDLIEDGDSTEECLDVSKELEGQEELAAGPLPEASDDKNDALMAASTNATGGGAGVAGAANNQQRITVRIGNRRYGKKKKLPKKTLSSPFVKKHIDPRDGDDIVVETLVVRSTATVVWQDGTVEQNIQSTHLYPIHHLDNHEFFPGDFVSKANENNLSQTEYGVIQSVDHDERIAKVKWFNIYTKKDSVPTCKEVEELSVYDLKDHADYQYRPGTMVIRVSNFTNEDVNSTAGQVIDNYPDGRVRVWWAMGHITMCYPQDLFEINQNDHDHDGYLSDGSDNSWETQSEDSLHGQLTEREHIITGIDSVSDALGKLEKIHNLLPNAEKSEVHIDLVAIYTNCHYLDRLLKTSFFGPEHFGNALDSSRISKTYRAIQNIINVDADMDLATTPLRLQVDGPPVSAQSTSTPTKRKSSTEIDEVQCKRTGDIVTEDEPGAATEEENCENAKLIAKYRCEYNHMLEIARNSILVAFDIRNKAKNDSGVHSRGENSMSELTNSASDRDPVEPKVEEQSPSPPPELKPQVVIEFSDSCVTETIEVFALLIKKQLSKCRKLVNEKIKHARREAQEAKDTDDEHSDTATYDVEPVDVASDINEVEASPPIAQIDVEQNLPKCDAMEHTLDLNALSESLPPIDRPMACSSPSPTPKIVSPSRHSPVCENCFEVVPNAPPNHRFIRSPVTPLNKAQYQRSIHREYSLLQLSLPPGVIVRAYEDRMDLMSVMMVGPKRTPYQNALFFFDFQMGRDYPRVPPICHYTSYCTERLNPNLYEEGKVCVSLLGTWSGRDTEMWSITSTMLQVLVSIQGLILVDEPYYNEAGYEKQRGTQLGLENSRVYNEMAIIKLAHSTVKQLQNPPLIFRNELIQHFKEFGTELYDRIQSWADYSSEAQRLKVTSIKEMPAEFKAPCEMPEFPLLPCSRGFCVAVKNVLAQLKPALDALDPALNAPNASMDGVEQALEAISQPSTEWMAIETGKAPRAAPEEG